MQFKQNLFLGTVAFSYLAAASFVIPQDAPNGHYTVTIDTNGTASDPIFHGPVTNISKRSSQSARFPLKNRELPNPVISCNGYSMNTDDYSVALASLESSCNAGLTLQPYTYAYVVYNTATSYFCNYKQANSCPNNELGQADVLMNDNCGVTNAAFVSLSLYDKAYGRSNAGVSIC